VQLIRPSKVQLETSREKGYDADEVELLEVLTRHSTEPEEARFLVVGEHTCR